MPITFNPDGSLRLPGQLQTQKDEEQRIFDLGKVVRFNRRAVSDFPLTDELDISLSRHIQQPSRFESLFTQAKGLFAHDATFRFVKHDDHNYRITIISGKYRDSWICEFRAFIAESFGAKVQYHSNGNDFRKSRR